MADVQSSSKTFEEPLLTNNDATFDDDAYLMTMVDADAFLPSMTFSGLFDVGLNAEELKGKLYICLSLDASKRIPSGRTPISSASPPKPHHFAQTLFRFESFVIYPPLIG
jgi:hypothetical protein